MQDFIYDLSVNAAGSAVTAVVLFMIRRAVMTWRANRSQHGEGGSADSDS